MNEQKMNELPIRLELLARTIIKISHGRDEKGKVVYFNPKDADKVKSNRLFLDSNGEPLANGHILLSPASRVFTIKREDAKLAELLKNHEACYESPFGTQNSLFKIFDPLEDKKKEMESFNKKRISQQVFFSCTASDLSDLYVYFGYNDDLDIAKTNIYALSTDNPDAFLRLFEKATVKTANGFYASTLLEAIKVEANVRRGIKAKVIKIDDNGNLVFEGTKLGANIQLAVENLKSDNKDGLSKTYVLIKDKLNKNG